MGNRSSIWDRGYSFAYRVRCVYGLHRPVLRQALKSRYGKNATPKNLICVPEMLLKAMPIIVWSKQERILRFEHEDFGGDRSDPVLSVVVLEVNPTTLLSQKRLCLVCVNSNRFVTTLSRISEAAPPSLTNA